MIPKGWIYHVIQKLGPYGYPQSWWPGAWTDDRSRRRSFQESISYCVPRLSSCVEIRHFAIGKTILEIGAGRGLLTHCLEEQQVSIIPTDKNPPRDCFTQVYRLDHQEALRRFPSAKVLLLSWPELGEYYAYEALTMFRGDFLIYWGEGENMSCADESFFYEIGLNWMEVKHVDVPQWEGFRDYLYFFRRK